jgi:ABC-type dipeptide/oligopeptide/nickel transport system permease component
MLSNDYVRTARSKGLPESRVVLRHAFGTALVPIVTAVRPSTVTIGTSAVPKAWRSTTRLSGRPLERAVRALITRFTRASMLDVLSNDYVRTARSKGLPESRVVPPS